MECQKDRSIHRRLADLLHSRKCKVRSHPVSIELAEDFVRLTCTVKHGRKKLVVWVSSDRTVDVFVGVRPNLIISEECRWLRGLHVVDSENAIIDAVDKSIEVLLDNKVASLPFQQIECAWMSIGS